MEKPSQILLLKNKKFLVIERTLYIKNPTSERKWGFIHLSRYQVVGNYHKASAVAKKAIV